MDEVRPIPEGFRPVTSGLAVPEPDGAFERAVAAGAEPLSPVSDMFWGDRLDQVVDPVGFRWTLATRVKNLSQEEMRRAGEEFAKQMTG